MAEVITPESGNRPAPQPKGRPRGFDRDQVLDALIGLFSEKGFEATAMSDVVEATGLNKSSLYNAFGSKDELFGAALDRYLESVVAGRLEMMFAGGGLADLHGFVDMGLVMSDDPEGRMGCMALNASAELGLVNEDIADVSRSYRERFRAAFRRELEGAASAGEIDPDNIDVYVENMLAFAMSFPILLRSGATRDELEPYVRAQHDLIDSWRR